ncbi:hypothetical protein ACFLTP_07715 [Chloroflexota bacterium]
MLTEIRQVDNLLVVYTEDNDLYQKLRDWRLLVKVVKYSKGDNVVGADLYYPLSAKDRLIKTVKNGETKTGYPWPKRNTRVLAMA